MSDLEALYQDVILDHCKRPRNFRAIEGAEQTQGYNPLCGDKVTIYVKMDGDRISDIGFEGSGCAISTASASILTETLKGKTPGNGKSKLGKLAVFSGVSEFPARVKCATLAWHTLMSALSGSREVATTEGTDGEDLAAR